MSDSGHNVTPLPLPGAAPGGRPRLKKLRLLAVLIPVMVLAGISTVFGMMMAVASDLPELEAIPQVEKRKNSILLDAHGTKLATLTSNDGRIIVRAREIPPLVRFAVIAIEDRRFYENSGVDVRGIARAFVQGLTGGQRQGASTIPQQFIKVALEDQEDRTVVNKVREAALAYHMTRKWSKEKILEEYLNAVYFGNGAYGIESAAQTYFGRRPEHEGCGVARRRCVTELEPAEAALLAGIIQSPSGYDPVAHPQAAKRRRDLVLRYMLDQRRITRQQYDEAVLAPLPDRDQVAPPRLRYDVQDVKGVPYFVSWVRQQLVDHLGARQAFEGGLRITTTLDLEMQRAAEAAVNRYLSWQGGPTASVVAIDNRTGEVRAMVGGHDYDERPFNLATQGQRQPGSAFKPFILAEALRQGYGPGSVWPSRKREFKVPNSPGEKFVVNNFDDNYSGSQTLAGGLTTSDNAVFAAAGIKVGTKKVARLAERMGIRTPVSDNLAMTLGGLREGVTPLDMAHAYETFATGGLRISGTLGSGEEGPVGIKKVERNVDTDGNGRFPDVRRNRVRKDRVLGEGTAQLATQLLQGPVKFGTAKRAAYGGFAAGKTGTTENNGDAWFVGFTERFTIAVWVGYPDTLKPMESEFGGQEVTGGTFPALIWHDLAVAAKRIYEEREAERRKERGLPPKPTTTTTPVPAPAAPSSEDVPDSEAPDSPATDGGGSGGTGGTGGSSPSQPRSQQAPQPEAPAMPEQPAPQPETPATPAPATPTPGGTGDGGTGGTGAAAGGATPPG
ncbi:transglycosylase domain-containing protein [Conexibacter sp. SYSU D00693]|uniref:transglycosylase domain-containing protein n=1 Tax=Conexibacter sp. SYSU D00693 TaxID=2812560 RepID=UPI00196A9D3D|nr:transglycosylase domain-containing protein [Conexibacter sp. SYSU D00693]